MDCKDCLYYNVCNTLFHERCNVLSSYKNECKRCQYYSNKSEWVHLPCKIGTEFSDTEIVDDISFRISLCADGDIFTHDEVHVIDKEDIGEMFVSSRVYTFDEVEKALAERKK